MVDRVGTNHTLRNKLCFIYLMLRYFCRVELRLVYTPVLYTGVT
uniref:Uncharacterized protein n=1 Tax=Anguilla anguilla TaxID=7936 RepID=A0A0E9U0W0_ANGAN